MASSDFPPSDDLASAKGFIDAFRDAYGALLRNVKSACQAAAEEMKPDVVKAIYSRGAKQSGAEIKATHKLPKALRKERAAGLKRDPRSTTTYRDVGDVIGVTVVVQYPDQIEPTLETIIKHLSQRKIRLRDGPSEKSELGYYAFHTVFRHSDTGLCCEVQCKTMLHDAWATKMHDLTYKPVGFLDHRLTGLMQTFGDTLQLLERQSVSIRDIIRERWEVEADRRHAARRFLVEWVKSAGSDEKHSPEFQALLLKMDGLDAQSRIANLPVDDPSIGELKDAINSHPDVQERWMLAAYLAGLRRRGDLSQFLETHVDRWLTKASEIVQASPVAPASVAAAPVTLHASGDIEQAIAYYSRLDAQCDIYKISAEHLILLRFNWANALIERQYYQRSSEAVEYDEQRRLVDRLLEDCGKSTTLSATSGAVADTHGFRLIAFAQDPDAVQQGIAMCEGAKPKNREDSPAGWEYTALHIRLGWRRLFEIEQQLRN